MMDHDPVTAEEGDAPALRPSDSAYGWGQCCAGGAQVAVAGPLAL